MDKSRHLVNPTAHFERVVRSLLGSEQEAACNWCPAFDVLETADAVLVRADLPGVDPTKIEIAMQENVLHVKGDKVSEERPADLKAYRFERRAGAFERTLRLPETIDATKITAESRHGVLTITLPKRAEILPQRVTVQVKE